MISLTHDDIITFGKHKGEKLRHVPAGYLLWWLDAQPASYAELKKKPEISSNPRLVLYIFEHIDELQKSAAMERKEHFNSKESHDRSRRHY